MHKYVAYGKIPNKLSSLNLVKPECERNFLALQFILHRKQKKRLDCVCVCRKPAQLQHKRENSTIPNNVLNVNYFNVRHRAICWSSSMSHARSHISNHCFQNERMICAEYFNKIIIQPKLLPKYTLCLNKKNVASKSYSTARGANTGVAMQKCVFWT